MGKKKRSNPIIVIIPGLTGDATKLYIQAVTRDCLRNGFDIALINFRGVGGVPVTIPEIFSAVTN